MSTNPTTLPNDIKKKLLGIRDALAVSDVNEAYHILYSIACPGFDEYKPWEALEQDNKEEQDEE